MYYVAAALAGEGRRRRPGQRVRGTRAARPRPTCACPRPPGCAAPSSPWVRRSWAAVLRAGRGAGRGCWSLTGRPVDLSGYGPFHVNAVALGGLLYGFAAVWLVRRTLRRHFAARTARAGGAADVGRDVPPLVHGPAAGDAHTASAFLAAALPVAVGPEPGRAARARRCRPGPAGRARACACAGRTRCCWSLPALDALRGPATWPAPRAAARLALTLGAAALGLVPQMLVWHALYGEWLLAAPPQGADFVRLTRPFLLETLFSSRHGLLSWTPVLWAGYLGFVPTAATPPVPGRSAPGAAAGA